MSADNAPSVVKQPTSAPPFRALTDDLELAQLSFAVVDVETTGFRSATHRIVELAVVHVEGLGDGRLVLDTLTRPDRRVGNRDVHGITNRDVRKAPALVDVAGSLCDALTGRVLVAHNAAFDLAFLEQELVPCGVRWPLPALCTRNLHRAMAQRKADLEAALASFGVKESRGLHSARGIHSWRGSRLAYSSV